MKEDTMGETKKKVKTVTAIDKRGMAVTVNRDEHNRLAPGASLNPSGRPKGSLNMTTRLKEAITMCGDGKGTPAMLEIVNKVVSLAKEGDKEMIKLIWNYVDGKPVQRIDVTSAGDGVTPLSNEQREKLDAMFEDDSTTK